MKRGRGCFAICHIDGFVYVFGGVSGERSPDLKEASGLKYGVGIRNAVESPSMFQSKKEREIYGADRHYNCGLIAECEKYDVVEDVWYQVADLPIPLKNASACALSSDTIYVFGGQSTPQVAQKMKRHQRDAENCAASEREDDSEIYTDDLVSTVF